MRYQGRITDWRDDRGFGFITPHEGDGRVFVHISAFGRQRRPDVDERVTYELVHDPKKGGRAEEVLYLSPRNASVRNTHEAEAPKEASLFGPFVFVVIAVAVCLYGWERLQPRLSRMESGSRNTSPIPARQHAGLGARQARALPVAGSGASAFRCEGKHYCSEMTSCAEAVFYVENCPATRMDGNGDGVPCESQWCSS